MPIKLTYSYVKEYIKTAGYFLLSEDYKNCSDNLHIKCNKGHNYLCNWNNFKKGNRCPVCNGGVKLSYDHVKKQIESVMGYKLLSKKYKNAHTKLKVQCDKGHVYEVIWNSFQRGRRCPICDGTQKLTYKHVKNEIEKSGYKLLSSSYKNCGDNLLVSCGSGHEYEVKYYNFKSGYRCPICYRESTSSKAEVEVQEFISTLCSDQINNDRQTILNPNTGHFIELDVYLPEHHKAIEYNGTYWHSLPKAIEKDKIKQSECNRLGIDLLIIHEQNYVNDKQIEFDKIRKFINET